MARNAFILVAALLLIIIALAVGTSISTNNAIARDKADGAWETTHALYVERLKLAGEMIKIDAVAKYAPESVISYDAAKTEIDTSPISKDLIKVTQKDLDAFDRAQRHLSSAIQTLFLIADKNPDLATDAKFKEISTAIRLLDSSLLSYRQKTVQAVIDYNERLDDGWPRGTIAKARGHTHRILITMGQ